MREKDGRIYYEVGDKVRVIDEAPRWCNVGFSLGMRALLSQVLTIKSVNAHDSYTIYRVEENGWAWEDMLFQGLEPHLFLSDDEEAFEKPILSDFLKLYIKRLR